MYLCCVALQTHLFFLSLFVILSCEVERNKKVYIERDGNCRRKDTTHGVRKLKQMYFLSTTCTASAAVVCV